MAKKLLGFLFVLVSGLFADSISAYLYAPYNNSDNVKNILSSNGFSIIGEYDAMNDKNYHVIVYTTPQLKSLGSKKNRIFASVQKVLVDDKDKKLVLTNPNYFVRAFTQDDLDENKLNLVNMKLKSAFKNQLKQSDDLLDKDDIKGYHFMFGMPYYEDMLEVAKGDNLDSLIENKSQLIVFKLKNGNATLYGVSQNTKNGEKAYISAISQENKSAFLPYMVMIQDNKAYILHPKYYLAISLPKLSMGEFMTISDAPDNIEEFFKSLFNK